MKAIEIRDLSKSFRRMFAVDNLNMTVPVGAIYGHGDRIHNVKKLSDIGHIIIEEYRIFFYKKSTYKTGRTGEISRQTDSTHSQTVIVEWVFFMEIRYGRSGIKVHIVVQIGKMIVKGRIVGKDIKRVIVYFETFFYTFHNYALNPVTD